jgi:V/A-type H+-transporting ATPase subunit A
MDSTGGFWGLSQDRADAKKYPAIDPLVYTSSVYESFISNEDRNKILATLQEANGIDQTISTIGLKKVPIDKYILFQKGLTIDFCVLQQNAFHTIDAVTRPERLAVINKSVQALIDNDINFSQDDKEDDEFKLFIKSKFDNLRQWWKSWNESAKTDEELAKLPNKISQFIHSK